MPRNRFVHLNTLNCDFWTQTLQISHFHFSAEVASGLQPRGWVPVGPLRSLQGGKRLRHTSSCLGIDSSTRALSAARFAGATGRFGSTFASQPRLGRVRCCVIGIRWVNVVHPWCKTSPPHFFSHRNRFTHKRTLNGRFWSRPASMHLSTRNLAFGDVSIDDRSKDEQKGVPRVLQPGWVLQTLPTQGHVASVSARPQLRSKRWPSEARFDPKPHL
jgi:hypothetical protein